MILEGGRGCNVRLVESALLSANLVLRIEPWEWSDDVERKNVELLWESDRRRKNVYFVRTSFQPKYYQKNHIKFPVPNRPLAKTNIL